MGHHDKAHVEHNASAHRPVADIKSDIDFYR